MPERFNVGRLKRFLIATAASIYLALCASGQPSFAEAIGSVASPVVGEIFKTWRRGWILKAAQSVYDVFMTVFDNMWDPATQRGLLVANPPMLAIRGFMEFFINMLLPFYVLAIILTGGYVIFVSQSPEERARAKFWLGKLVIGMALITISPMIMEVALHLSTEFTKLILGLGDANLAIETTRVGIENFWQIFTTLTRRVLGHRAIGGISMALFCFSFLFIIYMFIVFRYVVIGLLAVLFPVSLFLYSFQPTKDIGKSLLDQTFVWIFMQFAWAVGLIVIGISIATIPAVNPDFPIYYASFAALVLFTSSPMMILGIMDWLSLSLSYFGHFQAAPFGTGLSVIDEMGI